MDGLGRSLAREEGALWLWKPHLRGEEARSSDTCLGPALGRPGLKFPQTGGHGGLTQWESKVRGCNEVISGSFIPRAAWG